VTAQERRVQGDRSNAQLRRKAFRDGTQGLAFYFYTCFTQREVTSLSKCDKSNSSTETYYIASFVRVNVFVGLSMGSIYTSTRVERHKIACGTPNIISSTFCYNLYNTTA